MDIYQPIKAYDKEELSRMYNKAKNQIGRVYRMRNYWNEKDSEGTHCSQYISEILNESGRYKFEKPWKMAPVDVIKIIKKDSVIDELVQTIKPTQKVI